MSDTELQEWAISLAAQKLGDRDRRAAEARKIVSDREVIQRSAKPMWKELSALVDRKVAVLVEAMEGEPVLTVRRSDRGEVIQIFSGATGQEVYKLRFNAVTPGVVTSTANYRLHVEGVSELTWSNPDFPGNTNSDTIAHLAVTAAFRQV